MKYQNLSKDFCMKILDKINQPVFVKDENGVFVYVNNAFLQFLGVKIEDVIGKNFDDTLPVEQRDHFIKVDKMVMGSGIEYVCEEKLNNRITKTTKRFYVDENGKKFVVGNFEDMTEIREDEAKILEKNKELVVLNKEKDDFISIVAHDLRSPFQSFLGFIDLLVNDSGDMTEEEIRDIHEMLLKKANETFDLLENLLSWIKGERGLLEPDPKFFPVLTEIKKIIDTNFTEIIKKKEIEIFIDGLKSLFVFMDIGHFNSIIRNLISNSIKFSKKGGRINISVKKVGNDIEISVTDFGIGMSKEILDILFEFNANKNRKGTKGEFSAGLGLLNCHTLIKNNNGIIRVESETEKGSTFFITLPSFFKTMK